MTAPLLPEMQKFQCVLESVKMFRSVCIGPDDFVERLDMSIISEDPNLAEFIKNISDEEIAEEMEVAKEGYKNFCAFAQKIDNAIKTMITKLANEE